MEEVKSLSMEVHLPDIYFEFTSEDFSVAPHLVKEKGQYLCDLWETKRMLHMIYTRHHIIKCHTP